MIALIPVSAFLVFALLFRANLPRFSKCVLGVFDAWWACLLLLASVFPYSNYPVNIYIMLLQIIYYVGFNFGFLLFSVRTSGRITRNRIKNRALSINEQYNNYINGNKFLLAICIVVVLALLFYDYRYSRIMTPEAIASARIERYYVGSLFQSTLELLIYNNIISVFRYLFAFVIAYSLVYSRYRDPLFWLSIIGMVSFSYIGSGRFPIVLTVVLYLLMVIYDFIYCRENRRVRVASMLRIVCLLCFAIAAMSYVTAFRRGTLTFSFQSIFRTLDTLFDQAISYNIGPFSALSYLYNNGELFNHFYMGVAVFFDGIMELISTVLSFIGIVFSSPTTTLATLASRPIPLGENSFNALYSAVYWMYSDSGLFGVIFYSILFGLIVRSIMLSFELSTNLFRMMAAFHSMYFVFVSNMVWQMFGLDSLVYLLSLLYLSARVEKIGSVNDVEANSKKNYVHT